jgi:tetratricopeptide (TPR) repeat protein
MAEFLHQRLGDQLAAFPYYEEALIILDGGGQEILQKYYSTYNYPEEVVWSYLDCLLDCGLLQAADRIAHEQLPRSSLPGWAARYAEERGDMNTAISQLEEGLTRRPDYHTWRYQLGIYALIQGHQEKAAELFHRAIESLRPQEQPEAKYLVGLAVALRRLGQEMKAKELEEAALEVDPVGARAAFMHIYSKLKEWRQVVHTAELALAQDPNSSFALNHKARAHAAMGNEGQAIEVYQELLRLQPRNGRAALELAEVHLKAGEAADARRALLRALRGEMLSRVEQKRAMHMLERLPSSADSNPSETGRS